MQTRVLDHVEQGARVGLHGPAESMRGHSGLLASKANGLHRRYGVQGRVEQRQYAPARCDGSGIPDRSAAGRRIEDDRARHHRRTPHRDSGENKAATADPDRRRVGRAARTHVTCAEIRHKVKNAALLVNQKGKRLTAPALRSQFEKAKEAAAEAVPALAEAIKNFRFYDLRAKAADDTADGRGEEAARDLLGHDSVKTTQRHYLRRGKIVTPTK